MKLFDKAKALSLVAWFEAQSNEVPHISGSDYRFSLCPRCGSGESHAVSVCLRRNTFFCHRCSAKGSIIDAESMRAGVSAMDAARALVDAATLPAATAICSIAADAHADHKQHALTEVIAILKAKLRTSDDPRVRAYLRDTRGIPDAVIDDAKAQSLIAFLPGDPATANAWLFEHIGPLLLSESELIKNGGFAGIAYKPLITFLGDDAVEFRTIKPDCLPQFKITQYGRSPDKHMYLPGSVAKATVVEGIIDLLSARALGSKNHLIGLAGCRKWSPELFAVFAQKHSVRHFVLALDNDDDEENAGQQAADALTEVLVGQGALTKRFVPPVGNDINDILRASRQL